MSLRVRLPLVVASHHRGLGSDSKLTPSLEKRTTLLATKDSHIKRRTSTAGKLGGLSLQENRFNLV